MVDERRRFLIPTYVFGLVFLGFLIWTFWLGPSTLPSYKLAILGIVAALDAAVFAYCFTGELGLRTKTLKTRFGDIAISATGGFGVFVLILLWWFGPFSPIKPSVDGEQQNRIEHQSGAIKRDTGEAVRLLEKDLRVKVTVSTLSGMMIGSPAPSKEAVALASQIPFDAADPYARALKAVVEGRKGDARVLLYEAEREKAAELSKIHTTLGDTELYSGNYTAALKEYLESRRLNPKDPFIQSDIAQTLSFLGNEKEAAKNWYECLPVLLSLQGENGMDYLAARSNIATHLTEIGDFRGAIGIFREVLPRRIKFVGADDSGTIVCQANYGVSLFQNGERDEALRTLSSAYEHSKTFLGTNEDTTTQVEMMVGIAYLQVDFEKAFSLLKHARDVRVETHGLTSPDAVESRCNYGTALESKLKFEDAEGEILSCELVLKSISSSHPKLFNVYAALCSVYRNWGKFDKARPAARSEVEHAALAYGKASRFYTEALADYAVTMDTSGDHAGGSKLFTIILGSMPQFEELSPYDKMLITNNAGRCFLYAGKVDVADRCFQHALQFRAQLRLGEDGSLGALMNNFGKVKFLRKNFDGAQVLYDKALSIVVKTMGHDSPGARQIRKNIESLRLARAEGNRVHPRPIN